MWRQSPRRPVVALVIEFPALKVTVPPSSSMPFENVLIDVLVSVTLAVTSASAFCTICTPVVLSRSRKTVAGERSGHV